MSENAEKLNASSVEAALKRRMTTPFSISPTSCPGEVNSSNKVSEIESTDTIALVTPECLVSSGQVSIKRWSKMCCLCSSSIVCRKAQKSSTPGENGTSMLRFFITAVMAYDKLMKENTCFSLVGGCPNMRPL